LERTDDILNKQVGAKREAASADSQDVFVWKNIDPSLREELLPVLPVISLIVPYTIRRGD
jgi:hypothetical protein